MNPTKNPLDTLRESDHSPETTVREGIPPQSGVLLGQLVRFREYVVTKPLPTKGAEADLYLVQRDEREFILKLYRNAMAPKREVLSKIWALSRDNPHQLVSILDVGFDESSGRWYEIMEYVPLGSLRDAEFRWGDRRAFVPVLVRELTAALHLLHQNGIVHCDLKPSNILIRSFDPPDLILTDFGIASQIASDVSLKMTTHKGTPMYWAPEAFSGLVAPASDWWGLGVIALEYLLGAHPFEGFGQQQITYQLTVKNIEIPPGTGEMEPLLKGLLTKDVAKRWGYEQITRWLAGERDIPVHYEAALAEKAPPQSRGGERVPFRFEGAELLTLEEVARAFAESEERWQLGAGEYLRYVRQWLEKNGEFDKAVKLGELLTGNANSDLFHFVHSNASLPFIYMGRTIDSKALLELVQNVEGAQTSPQEREIIKALESGLLSDLLNAYCGYQNTFSPSLGQLIAFLRRVPKSERRDYVEVLAHPEEYFWPLEPSSFDHSDVITRVDALKGLPVTKKLVARLSEAYNLPGALLERLKTEEGYHSAIGELLDMEEQALLLNKSGGTQDSVREAEASLGLEEYKSLAKTRNWILEEELERSIALSCAQLASMAREMPKAEALTWAIDRLQGIRDKKVTQADRDCVAKVADTLARNADDPDAQVATTFDYVRLLIPCALILLLAIFPASDDALLVFLHSITLLLGLGSLIFFAFLANYLRNYGQQAIDDRILYMGSVAVFFLVLAGGSLRVQDLFSGSINEAFLPPLWGFFYRNIYLLHIIKYMLSFGAIAWEHSRWNRRIADRGKERYQRISEELHLLRWQELDGWARLRVVANE